MQMTSYLQLDGVNDYLEIPSNPLYTNTGAYEISFRTSTPSREKEGNLIFGKYNGEYFSTNGIGMYVDNGGFLLVQVKSVQTDGSNYHRSSMQITDGLQHVVKIEFFDQQTIKVYIDGTLDGTIHFNETFDSASTPIRIGKSEDTWWGMFKGDLFYLKVYNDVNTLVGEWDFRTGTVLDQTSNNNNATLIGGTWVDNSNINTDEWKKHSSEIYILSQDDKLLTTLSESTGLVSTMFKDQLNNVPDEPFIFTVYADVKQAQHVKEENQVVFRDKEGDLRLYVIKELDDVDNNDGPQTTATCEPAFMELNEHVIEDRRFVDKEAQEALTAALQGTRWTGTVEVSLGKATTNFYYISSVDAIWNILEVWGGEFKDVVTFDGNKITKREIRIKQRLGADRGAWFEIDHNIEEIERTVLSYPVTALYGRGASLEIEDEETGEHTGGYTRLIDFADVEWKKSKGDPVDKPKGQKWVGDPDALLKYGRKHNGQLLHRYGIFENGDYEDPAELLWATWQQLQEEKKAEVNYRLAVHLFDKPVSLGDTARAFDRQFTRPIEIQTRVIAIEYDLLDIEGTTVVEMGQFLSAHDDDLYREINDIKESLNKPRPTKPIDGNSFPDIKPGTPVNVEANGAFQTIHLFWDYDSKVYISHYEVYGSQVKDFIPDSQHMLWRGRTSAFNHEVSTDEVWYYRVRAVNTRGTPGDFSPQVSAATVRIITDDILFGSIIADHLTNNLDIADKLAQNTIDRINEGPMQEIQYKQAEIQATENRLLEDLANKAGLDYVNGQLISKVDNIDFQNAMFDVDTQLNTINASVTNISGNVDSLTGQVNNVNAQVASLDIKANQITQSVSEVRADLDGLEIGGRNLASRNKILAWENGFVRTDNTFRLTGLKAGLSIHENTYEPDTGYVFSFKFKKISGTIKSVAGHAALSNIQAVYRDGVKLSSSSWSAGDANFPDDNKVYSYTIYFKTKTEIGTTNDRIYIQPNRVSPSYAYEYVAEVWDLQLEKGNKATDWTPAPEDTDARIKSAETLIDQKADKLALSAVSTSVDSLTGRMSNAETTLNLIPGQLEAKVDNDGIVQAINFSKEGILISGTKLHITAQTEIDDAVIGTAAIADASITRAKFGKAVIGTAQIEDAAITDAKVATLSADKLNAGAIRGIDVYGSKFRSSDGYTSFYVEGGNVLMTVNDGRKMTIDNSGIYYKGANGDVLFQSSRKLTTSDIFGTSEHNVYLASFKETRSVTYDTALTGSGYVDDYVYVPHRAQGYYGNFLNVNPYGDAVNVYLRPLSNGEVRVTRNETTNDYLPLRAQNVLAHRIMLNEFDTSSKHLYIYAPDEVRISSSVNDNGLGRLRASDVYASSITLNALGNAQHLNLFVVGSDAEVRIKHRQDDSYRPISAADFKVRSSRKSKENITPFKENALDAISGLEVVEFNYKHDDSKRIGFIAEASSVIASSDNEFISLSEVTTLLTKATKELDMRTAYIDEKTDYIDEKVDYIDRKINEFKKAYNSVPCQLHRESWDENDSEPASLDVKGMDGEIEHVKDEMNWLKLENQYLKQKIKQLEDKIA
ncbi:hypothetical protein D5F11_007210 [Siminovitchia terrae]|uniref:Peptidase S74 domain-containing protein n=1 Tax=Siminovitchia terrae TaxID=1914933 RepID=A0A429X9Y9_SIMTE|nr:phage tail spike protein [Siminovitchia terrae]RST60237.1 hypothetical protein D5F11_007210 [Siminovitchia terrae]